jgi:hypothetical protein
MGVVFWRQMLAGMEFSGMGAGFCCFFGVFMNVGLDFPLTIAVIADLLLL